MTPKALSREIKFRVYNTDWKMMVLPEDIYYIKFQGEKSEATDVAFNITTTDGMRNNNIWENPEDIVFMQFTGLHDKNGKEIYEGDIVVGVGKTKDNNWQIKRKPKVVEWVSSKNGTGFNIVASPEDYADKTCMRTEIIGNIYESPELLTKENN